MKRPRRRHGLRDGDSHDVPQPPPLYQQPPMDYNQNFFFQNPALYAQFPPQTNHYNPYFQNPNFQFQEPNPYLEQIGPSIQHPYSGDCSRSTDAIQIPTGPTLPTQTPKQNSVQNQRPKFPAQSQHQQRNRPPVPRESLEKIEAAVEQSRRELVASAENVSAWKVSQSALVKLKAESWDSLGFQLQQVPSLHRLIVIEEKINAFIHCFVAVRSFTSVYDLEVAICENEGIEKFVELELGPLTRHPLVKHYFSSEDMTEIYKITGEEFIQYLKKFIEKIKGKSFQGNELLDFVAKSCKVSSWEKMGLRIQSLGKHVGYVRAGLRQEKSLLRMCMKKGNNSGKKSKKRPLFSLGQKQIDGWTQHATSISSAHKEFLGKHTQFNSSSSDDNDAGVDYGKDECDIEQIVYDSHKQKDYQLSLQNIRSDKVSSWLYQSEAEKMVRLGLREETHSSPPTCVLKNIENDEPAGKKRKLEKKSYNFKDKTFKGDLAYFDDDSIRIFITTWKDACCQLTATEVFGEMMRFYDLPALQKRTFKKLLRINPFLGLLNVAVISIKNGSWDSTYDMFQSFDEQCFNNTQSKKCIEHECLDVGSSGKDLLGSTNQLPGSGLPVTVEDIMQKVSEYFANEISASGDRTSLLETMIIFARKLLHCEVWLSQKYGVKEFGSLGYGEYLTFLERHISLLPKDLHDNFNGRMHEELSFEVNLLKQQVVVLLSQASDSLWEDGIITKQRIANLVSRQFPSISFNVVEKGCLDNIPLIIKEHKSSIASNCLLFSATLLGMYNSGGIVHNIAKHSIDCTGLEYQTGKMVESVGSLTTKDAVEVILRAPMLTDLNSWLHWDIIYAPSLGPLLMWLLTEVNAKDLLCLLTRDGKTIRIDPSASVDSFYESLLKGSPSQVAVELLSLFALFRGRRHLPLSLLKFRARQAFEFLLTNPTDRGQSYGNCLSNEKTLKKQMINEYSGFKSGTSVCMEQNDVKEATFHASRLVLDCLGYLPSEFYSLASDILLSGLQSVVKYAPSSILLQCRSKHEHLMLHEIGFALGITEWIDDHLKVCPIIDDQPSVLMPILPLSCLGSQAKFKYQQQASAKMLLPEDILSAKDDLQYEGTSNLKSSVGDLETDISVRDNIKDAPQVGEVKDAALVIESIRHIKDAPQVGEVKDAALVIESIRHQEFGLDLDVESGMLNKQHARLGRALRCLSQELYSQDSHFLLELIQNADDNSYSKEVEPTLMFILQKSRILVLNNEQGFTAQNIIALCDIGNSTKKGSSSRYIGHKGIGFKSVFRVTDAPEIHSNGFHIKFDITEGQIGFVLPTVVPPCNIDLIRQLASTYTDPMDNNCWNTCIVLPLRSKLTQGLEMCKIVSMFSDIHPSLLLFINRLQCIKLINVLDNSFFAMRKEIVGDGLVRVTYGENTMTWFIASKKLFPEIIRPGVQVTEISIAVALKEYENGKYKSHLEQQPVFAFLPLRTYGFKFILQGDFALPSSREEIDGDSPWNQWLLSEFPDLFVSAEKQFCALPCFRENPGKALTIFMHFVPLIGEAQGFFSGLPRMIISRLWQSDCLLQEGCNKTWVPPCKVLRNWNEQACMLLPDILLEQHLGLGFLDKDIILSDSIARVLGIQDYGPKILVQCISSICSAENGLKSMGLHWLSSWLNELHNMLHSHGRTIGHANLEFDLFDSLKNVPCVPLSDGTYGSIHEGTIWLHTNSTTAGSNCNTDSISFPKLYASMRIVNPRLFSAATHDASCMDVSYVNNVASILNKMGVQHLTAHAIIKEHILPVISDDKIASLDKSLFIECNAFAMLHFQSSCADCIVEKENIISEFQSKALLLTNLGFKKLSEATIHFGKEFGSPIDASRFFCGMDYKWHEIDDLYLKYPLAESISSGLLKWREFFHGLGVTDFVKVTQILRNICDISPINFQQVKWDRDRISSSMLIKDWESQELDCILSLLVGNRGHENERSKYLLEVLDTLWDDYFSDKTACYFSLQSDKKVTSFKSSLMNNICDIQWVTSSMDDELHYPRELFYDCDAVRSILGNSVPYAIPKIRNSKMLTDIGFKTQVTIGDILTSLLKWRALEPFKASVSQMSRLYTIISKESADSKKKALEALRSGPFIFVPHASGISQEDVVVGSFFSPDEVYWHDYSSALDSMKNPSSSTRNFPMGKMLRVIYPGLQYFFVDDCGVNETPPFRCYLEILKQLSMNTSPLHAASSVFQVFQVFLRWSDGMRCGSMVDGDILYLIDHLLQLDFAVLPTMQDKWVSLHSSFGLVCWSDDESLKNQFKHLDSIQLLYFGELTDDEKEMLQTKMSVLLRKLGIPALSEVVTCEAIYYGPSDCSFKASMVAWALPFAQRYIYTVHNDKYTQLKLSGFEKLRSLKIVVVEKLFSRNVVRKCGASSKKRFECSCLLQDTVLYTTQESDCHSLFMELSRLFFDGALDLHLANFLHMLTTMAESGSTEEQMEFFILNSQKMSKIPDQEPMWSISNSPLPLASEENDRLSHVHSTSITSKSKGKYGTFCWPPVGWKTAPGFDYGLQISEDVVNKEDRVPETVDVGNADANAQEEAVFVGRLGELIAFEHFKGKHETKLVIWVNEENETGLPYDIVIGDEESGREYVEVKATRYESKKWFNISTREWEFAVERGDRYSLARVVVSNKNAAERITVFENPVRLCQLRKLDLVIMVPRQ